MATTKKTVAPAGPAYQYAGTVLRVIDGDTAVFDIDLGFDVHSHQTVRFEGIDAPEKVGATKIAGMAARDAVMKLLPVGAQVVLKTSKPATASDEKYGRFLARVWVGGKDVSRVLLEDGVVSAYTGGKR